MGSALVTGGAGFFGSVLKDRLLKNGQRVISIDLESDETVHPLLTVVQGDIRDEALIARLFAENDIETVYHCAAILAHAVKDESFLWTSNVDGTRVLIDAARRAAARSFVFISSNCLWGQGFGAPVPETLAPDPVEIYGLSKWEGEKILQDRQEGIDITILRCPTILDEGRLGLLTFLFDFIREGRKVWVVGDGGNTYQFIYAQDLVEACLLGAQAKGFRLYHVGADDVLSFREVYEDVIRRAGTKAVVRSLPKALTLFGMRLAHRLGLSPLGPYHYKMIAESFVFDTRKIKAELGWHPTLRNQDMLWLAYRYYDEHLEEIKGRTDVSAHRQRAKMGIIRLLKWLS